MSFDSPPIQDLLDSFEHQEAILGISPRLPDNFEENPVAGRESTDPPNIEPRTGLAGLHGVTQDEGYYGSQEDNPETQDIAAQPKNSH